MNLIDLQHKSTLALSGVALAALAVCGVATAQTAHAGGPPGVVNDDTVWLPTDTYPAVPAELMPVGTLVPGEPAWGVACTQGDGQPDHTSECQHLYTDVTPRIYAIPALPLPPQ